jgi:hypothetical protein
MVLVSARLHGEVEVSASRLTELSRIIAGLDRHFLDGFHALLDDASLSAVKAVGGVLALNANRFAVIG